MIDRPKSEDAPGVASAENGEVTLDGPSGVAITLTPNAARETGRRLIEAADAAEKHRGTVVADADEDGGTGDE